MEDKQERPKNHITLNLKNAMHNFYGPSVLKKNLSNHGVSCKFFYTIVSTPVLWSADKKLGEPQIWSLAFVCGFNALCGM